jgi:DHA1 family tetracycline resistance protein-like MFS transporter
MRLLLGLDRNYWLLMVSLFLVNAVSLGQFTSTYLEELKASPEIIGVIFSLSTLVFVLVSPVGGAIGDVFGRKRLLILSPIIASASLLIIGLAPDWRIATVGMMVSNLSPAINVPSFQAYIADITPEEKFGRAFGLITSMFSICGVITPLVGGFMIVSQGYRMTILIIMAVTLIGGVSRFFLKETEKSEGEMKASTVFKGIFSPLKNKQIAPIVVAQMGYFLAMSMNYSFLTLFLNNIIGLGEDAIGLIFAVSAVSSAVTAPIAGRLAEKYSSRILLVTGLLADAVSVMLLINTQEFWGLIVIAIAWGAVATLYWPVMDAAMAKATRRGKRGAEYGSLESLRNVASLPGPFIGGVLWGTLGPVTPFYAFATLVIAVAIFVFLAVRV